MARERNALVLASTSGLGFACARALAVRGFDVSLCSRSSHSVERAIDRLADDGLSATGHVADISDPNSLSTLIDVVEQRGGAIDTVVTNSGGPEAGGLLDLEDADWKSGIELVLMSAVRVCRRVLPSMIDQRFGRVIVVGSSSARRPIPGLTLSNALRPALSGLIKDIAVQVAPYGITVNMVAPGRIDTNRTRELDERRAARVGTDPESIRASSESTIPAGRYGDPAEFASAVGYLASEESSYVTGQTLLVDGGLTASLP